MLLQLLRQLQVPSGLCLHSLPLGRGSQLPPKHLARGRYSVHLPLSLILGERPPHLPSLCPG